MAADRDFGVHQPGEFQVLQSAAAVFGGGQAGPLGGDSGLPLQGQMNTLGKAQRPAAVDGHGADDHGGGPVIAVFPTVDGNFRYAVDMEGYGALQFFAEERLVVHPSGTRAH